MPTTRSSVWLKNRLRPVCGRNPFALIRNGRADHRRESTLDELTAAARQTGLEVAAAQRRGLNRFSGLKDRCSSAFVEATHPSLWRTNFLVLQRPA